MSRKFTYATAGVDRKQRAESKNALKILADTYEFSHHGRVVQLPYGVIFPFAENCYLDLSVEGVGTKVLVAQLAEKYDTIGIDGVAMTVNDVIRSGARPMAIVDNIHMQTSKPELVKELLTGIVKGAAETECVVPGGEIGDVADIIKGLVEDKGFDVVVAAVGEVAREKIIYGRNVKAGDVIIGLKSSGVHSNGISLARRVLFKIWGGKFEPYDIPEGFDREVVYEVLEPTRIYVKPLLKIAEKIHVKAAVHITGDAYLKFDRLTQFSKNIGFEFNNFDPQPIFGLIQKTASELGGGIADEEMFKTFNMGWGFAIIVDKASRDETLGILKKAKIEAEKIGNVKDSEGIKIFYKKRKIVLK